MDAGAGGGGGGGKTVFFLGWEGAFRAAAPMRVILLSFFLRFPFFESIRVWLW
jgi:hypothetical protein